MKSKSQITLLSYAAMFSAALLVPKMAFASTTHPETCIVTEVSGKRVNAVAADLNENSDKTVDLQLLSGTRVIVKNALGWMAVDGQLFSTISVKIVDQTHGSQVESMIRVHRNEDDGQIDKNLSKVRYSPNNDSRVEISCTQIK